MVKAGTTSQEELKSAILFRCVGGQLKFYLKLTIGDNVQYSTLREQVLQWDRSQQEWATSMVASSCTDYQGPMPMNMDRVQDATGKCQSGKNDHQKGKGKDAKGNEGKGEQKGIDGDQKGKGKRKDQKGKGVAICCTCGEPGHLARDCWRNNIRQVASDPAHSSSGGASVTTHTVGQQQANFSQQSSSAEAKPVVRRIENSEPIIFDLLERDDEVEKSLVSSDSLPHWR